VKPLAHLTPATVKAIHAEVLAAHGGSAGIRDEALLESAVAAPQATAFGEPLLKDPVEIASAYLFYICSNHPFVDGNKRAALASCLIFLRANELMTGDEVLDVDLWEAFVLDVAASRIDREETIRRLRKLIPKPKAKPRKRK